MAWIVLRLGEPHRLLVEQHARVAEPRAEPRVIFQRADAAVDVDRGVDLGVAGIGDRDPFVFRAVGDEHVGDGADELRPLGIAHAAQRPLPLPAGESERAFEIDALGRHGRELVVEALVSGDVVGELTAQAIAVAVAMPFNFVGNKLWTFDE